jgi:hypothetical protein
MNKEPRIVAVITLQLDRQTIVGLRQMAEDRGLLVVTGPKRQAGRGNIQQLLRALVVDYHQERGA